MTEIDEESGNEYLTDEELEEMEMDDTAQQQEDSEEEYLT